MSWQTPKVDWTIADYYNYTDLNRVESNTVEVSNIFATAGYIATLAAAITNRTISSMDFYDSLNRIEANIQALETALGYAPSSWITPIVNWTYGVKFDCIDANRLELDLYYLYNNINNIIASFNYCHAIVCGETFNLVGGGGI